MPAGGTGGVSPPIPSLLGRRADDPVVAERADLLRRSRLELLPHDPVADVGDRRADALELLLGVLDRHLLARHHVQVALCGGLQAPGLPCAHLVDGELHVLAQLILCPSLPGLVVDQLVASVRTHVDAVDPPAQQVPAEPEGEAALEPDRLTLVVAQALPVALERIEGPLAELQLVVGVAEAGAAPGGLEEVEQLLAAACGAPVKPLEHLVQRSPEALVDSGLLGDAEDPGEL